jgi:hypothetical protein
MSETNLKELYDYVLNAPACGNCKHNPYPYISNPICIKLNGFINNTGLCDLHESKEVANG